MLPRHGWTNSWASIVYAYEKNGAGKYKKPKFFRNSVENVILMSAKTISSGIIPIVNQKGNRLYDIFAMKETFSGLTFVFRVFC